LFLCASVESTSKCSELFLSETKGIPLGTPFGLQISSHLFMGAFLFGRYWWDVLYGYLDQVEGAD